MRTTSFLCGGKRKGEENEMKCVNEYIPQKTTEKREWER